MSLRRRRLLLWIRMRLGHPLSFLLGGLWHRVAMRDGLQDYYAGIAVQDWTLHGRHRDLFLTSVREALDLIRDVDPRRFRMVCRHLTSIAADDLAGRYGHYDPFAKWCVLDLEWHGLQWLGDSHPWAVARLAATIVHEAAHGRLFDAGFGYDSETREMIERLCTMQARAFSQRLCAQHPEYTHLVEPAYHASRWHWAWHASLWARARRQSLRLTYAGRRRPPCGPSATEVPQPSSSLII